MRSFADRWQHGCLSDPVEGRGVRNLHEILILMLLSMEEGVHHEDCLNTVYGSKSSRSICSCC